MIRNKKIYIDPIHKTPIDPAYEGFNIEDISLYQRHFHHIINCVDVENYTKWSMAKQNYDRERLKKDDGWTYNYLTKIEKEESIDKTILFLMVNQFYFADIIARELDKECWIKRVLYRKPTDYFPDAASLESVMEKILE